MKKIYLLFTAISLFGISAIYGQYTDLHDFNGTNGFSPYGSLIMRGDTFYGMTAYGGAYSAGNVFSVWRNGSHYTDLYDFSGGDGAYPYGSLTLSITGDTLFGMTSYAGAYGNGDIFTMAPDGSWFADIYDFSGSSGGSAPNGSLVLSVTGDTLWGATSTGGTSSYGNVFCIQTNGSGYYDALDFNSYNGAYPYGSLIYSKGRLFGMASEGGYYGYGSIYAINPTTLLSADIYDFDGTSGYPYGSLTAGLTGDTLFGMTSEQGFASGNIFGFILGGGGYFDMYDFSGTDGYLPEGDLTLARSGTGRDLLYGMTSQGGVNGDGTLFSIKTNATHFVSLFNFNGTNGSYPFGAVTFLNDTMYGMTSQGGANTDGVIFDYGILAISGFKVSNVTCNNPRNGSASAIPEGGIPPYTYHWSPGGQTTQTINGLTAGSYTVVVTDSVGSHATSVAVISGVAVLVTQLANVTCYGGNNGVLQAKVTMGTGPFLYTWSGGTQQGPIDWQLSAGTYTLTVTDSCGMTATVSAIITQPSLLTISDSVTANVYCSGASDGSISTTTTGGASPYTYLWSDASSQTTATATGLSAGMYYVTVTDTNGCTAIDSATVNQPSKPPLGVTIARAKNVSCEGSFDGMALALGTGGTPPYTYLWNPGGNTTSIASGLSAGIYTIDVTDVRGCITSASINITQPSVLTITDTTISAYNLALAYPSGGTPPYTYSWTPGGGTGFMVSGISAGTYTVVVTDANSCQDSAVILLKQPLSAGLNLSLYYLGSTCPDSPPWATYAVYATSLPNTIFHNCVVDIHYSNSEFYPDSNGYGLMVYPDANFILYDYLNVTQLSDSVIEINFGDSTESAVVAATENILNDSAVALFYIQLQIQSTCQSGTLSFTNTLATMSESNYTDSTFTGGGYTYFDSAYTTVYTNSPQTSPACGGSAISITDFNSPIDAGVNSILTINGSGFGDPQGTGQVKFRDADSAHYIIQKLDKSDYISWRDDQIQIRLPAFADSAVPFSPLNPFTLGGGRFTVTNSCGDSMVSSTNLNSDTFSIYYNISQAWNIDTLTHFVKEEVLLRKYDTGGGYVFRLDSNSFPRNSYRRNLFYKAMRDWTCYTGMNWRIGKDTTIAYNFTPLHAVGVNYVFFTDSIQSSSGTVASTVPWVDGCSLDIVQLKEGDIYFNNKMKFIYDSIGTRAIGADSEDFYGVCLHELAHFMQLNHSTDPNALMYWTANQGYLSPANRQRLDTGIAAVNGAIYSVNQSVSTPGGCHTISPMTSKNASCHAPMGINDLKQNNNFTIYPNPSDGTFIIESSISDYTLIVTNVLGQRLFSKRIEEKKAEISLSSVANGMYFIQEQYRNGMATQKLIITK